MVVVLCFYGLRDSLLSHFRVLFAFSWSVLVYGILGVCGFVSRWGCLLRCFHVWTVFSSSLLLDLRSGDR